MKFILMMLKPYGTSDYDLGTWSPEDRKAHGMFMYMMDRELVESGERIAGEGLASPNEAKIVRAGPNGAPAITDGPFAESKEFLAGFWIVEVDRPERAYEIAAKASAAPWPGGPPTRSQVRSAPDHDRPTPSELNRLRRRAADAGTRYCRLLTPRFFIRISSAGTSWMRADLSRRHHSDDEH